MKTAVTVIVLAAAALLIAAGCGGASKGAKSGTLGATTTLSTTIAAPSIRPACRSLTAVTRQAVEKLGATLSGFATVRSLGTLAHRTRALQAQIASASARVAAVHTPPGPATRDKDQISAALSALAHQLASARKAAESGRIGTAAKKFAALAQLTGLRHAAASLASNCTR